MKKLLLSVLMLSVATGSLLAQQLRRRDQVGPAPVEELVEGFYVSRLQEELALSDEQFVKILPVLRQSLRERREKAQRRARALNELRQLMDQGASEEEIKKQVCEVDQAELDAATAQQKLASSVDPLLSPAQQAKWRIFQVSIEQRIRRMLDRSRLPGPPLPPGPLRPPGRPRRPNV